MWILGRCVDGWLGRWLGGFRLPRLSGLETILEDPYYNSPQWEARDLRLLLISIVLALPFCAQVQDSKLSDFSGTWSRNSGKSKLPKSVSSMPESIVIVCSGQTIQFTFTLDGQVGIKKYVADGQEHTERVMFGSKFILKAFWSSPTLETEDSTVSGDDGRRLVDHKERWQLSADGRTLTRESHDPTSVSVYDKQ
jgi:hypothetical protein